jgi:hypothetical protein
MSVAQVFEEFPHGSQQSPLRAQAPEPAPEQTPTWIEEVPWHASNAGEALLALERVLEHLKARGDSRAVFLDIYAIVTRRVVDLLHGPGDSGFLEPEWLSQLTGRFAEEALLAVRDSLLRRPLHSAAWRFATHYPAFKLTRPCQDALLGVSAHINHDLALSVYENLSRQSPPLNAARLERYRHDYFQVNEILRACIPECLELLAGHYRCPTTQRLLRLPFSRPVLERAIMQMLVVWRARVWENVLRLLAAPSHETRQDIVARIDRTSGRIAQVICSGDALRGLLRGAPLPFRLSRSAAAWPDVKSGLNRA